MRHFWRLLATTTVVVIALSSCSSRDTASLDPISFAPAPSRPKPLALEFTPEERTLLGDRPSDWGLALSGGGLRAAFFSIGVLKSLYDQRILDRIDVISTVSGGGYSGYWLYTNHAATWTPGQRFGTYSLSDDQFPQRLCEFVTRANFVTYGRAGGVLWHNLPARSVALYERSLRRTFGALEPADGLTLQTLAAKTGPSKAPYLIQNATIILPKAEDSWPRKLVEFTPLVYGTQEIGHVRWGGPGAPPIPLFRTTAVSGAAVRPLKQTLPLRHPATGAPSFTAHDGGKSENLGAIALIRRGVPNVIVADAEHDPGYVFDAYRTLRAGLSLYGYELSIPTIDDHLKRQPHVPYATAVARGVVTKQGSRTPVSTIYYIKASMADEIAADLARERVKDSPGAKARDEYLAALQRSAERPGGDWRCDALRSAPLPMAAWSAYSVASYADWLKTSRKARFVRFVSNVFRVPLLRIDFPQYSTGDQSFYTDQAQAFIGLGYLETREMAKMDAR